MAKNLSVFLFPLLMQASLLLISAPAYATESTAPDNHARSIRLDIKRSISEDRLVARDVPTSKGTSRQADPVAPVSRLDDLGWLTGRWFSKKDTKPFFEEHWTRPAGGVMIGMGRELGDRNALSFYEYLRIEAKPDGLYYVAQPFGKSSTAFKLISNNKSGALFENPAHDFPQKIHYLRRGPAELTVRLSAADKTKKPTEFVLYRDATPVDH